ncbi:MAG: hypothetical protein F6K55_02890 [Moorea sp. SIO4A3]|nr:hypothetical protein [Moorena sp. SIO4A3]
MFRTQTHAPLALCINSCALTVANLILNGKSAPNKESRQATEGGEVGED